MKEIRRKGLCYGGDYNPEQWPEAVQEEDIRLMKKAGVNFISLGIFSWALLQPREDSFDFSFLDRIMDRLADAGIGADLATATAAQPAWLSRQYPEILPVDESGLRFSYGSRQAWCPNSPDWKRAAARMARAMAERYRDHPALVMWHINNEYACHVKSCYCDTCAAEFRRWLQERYGSVEEVNRSWGTRFWSQYYYSWEEILPPRRTPAQKNPGQVLDYRRFMNDSILECYLMEKRILEEVSPEVEITTNFMMHFKDLDLFRWAPHLDVVSWDAYPDPAPGSDPSRNALDHDIMRSLKGGQPFLLMEQAPSQVNWREVNRLKPPGMMKLYSYQALAHGADGIMFFQWRQSLRGSEKFHSACVPHRGDENSRVFREVADLGRELKALPDLKDARYPAEAAILMDYENWWSLEYEHRQSREVRYLDILRHYYRAFYDRHLPVDLVDSGGDFSRYRMLVVPFLSMVKPGTAEALEDFTSRGGLLIVSCGSGLTDQEEAVFPGGYPGPLKGLLGLRVEEFDPLGRGERRRLTDDGMEGYPTGAGTLWQDRILPGAAEPVMWFAEGFLKGGAAVTVNRVGGGNAWYLGIQPDRDTLSHLMDRWTGQAGLKALLDVPEGIEMTVREGKGIRWLFLMNFQETAGIVSLGQRKMTDGITGNPAGPQIMLGPLEGRILREETGCKGPIYPSAP